MSKKDNKGCGCLGAFLAVFFVIPVVLTGIGAVVDYFEQREEQAFMTQWVAFFGPFDAAATDLIQAITSRRSLLPTRPSRSHCTLRESAAGYDHRNTS